jgi:hypothetical protein
MVILASLFTGCGLVAYPHRTQLPPSYFQTVAVCDAVSRLPLTNASVRIEGRYIKNWARLTPPLSAQPASERSGDTPKLVLLAQEASPGIYTFQTVHRSEWSHVLFPIGLPLGGVMHHYYDSSVVAESPGHTPVRVYGSPHVSFGPSHSSSSVLVEFSERVTIFLPRTTP